MDSILGEDLTRWTVRLAVACYLARVIVDLRMARRPRAVDLARQARRLWTAGCVLYVLHVICAFGFFHGWSHVAAYRHTAAQTAQVVGLAWGGGLYVNYAFTLLWMADVVVWFLRGANFPYRSPVYFWTIHGVFAFMVFNATVVFGPPVWKWVAMGIGAVVAALVFTNRRPSRKVPGVSSIS